MPDEEGLWCPGCGKATQAPLLGWCPMCDWEADGDGARETDPYGNPELCCDLTLKIEELDRTGATAGMAPQEPADAIRQLPYDVRHALRHAAMLLVEHGRRVTWTPERLKGLIEGIHAELCKTMGPYRYEAVDAYFRKAREDAEEWREDEREVKKRRSAAARRRRR